MPSDPARMGLLFVLGLLALISHSLSADPLPLPILPPPDAALVEAPAPAADPAAIVSSTVRRYSITGIRSSAAGLTRGARVLVGRHPVGVFTGMEGRIASWNGGAWEFVSPKPSDQAFDTETGEQYLFSGRPLLFDGVWVGSSWRRLSNERPTWQPGGSIHQSTTLGADDHGQWYLVSADQDFTITLEDPVGGDLEGFGIEIVIEPFDGAFASTTLVVEGDGVLMDPEGQLVTSFELPRATGRNHVYRLVAGTLVSSAAWYVVPGP